MAQARKAQTSLLGLAARGAILVATLTSACSAAHDAGAGTGGSGGFEDTSTKAASTSSGQGGAGGDETITTGSSGGGGGGGSPFDGCAASTVTADPIPLDLYFMVDQSVSMNDVVGPKSKWAVVTTALEQFLMDPSSTGLEVGLQFFGDPKELGKNSCVAADYAPPEVPIALLPGNAGALVKDLKAHFPHTDTPTAPALQGAVNEAKAFAKAHPTDKVAVVFVTDGDPSVCTPIAPADIAMIAKGGLAGPHPVRTFVIGMPGATVANLNLWAKSGGTKSAYVVGNGPNPTQKFIDALNAIRGTSPCEYALPTPSNGKLDYDQVNVELTPKGGMPEVLPRVADAAACGQADGWYYDDPKAPTKLVLCPTTCSGLNLNGGSIDIVLGCETVVK